MAGRKTYVVAVVSRISPTVQTPKVSTSSDGFRAGQPPFHHPVFGLTHHRRDTLELDGGNTFTFVTDGIELGLAQAKQAADKDIRLPTGRARRGSLRAGLVDEMEINLAPIAARQR